MSRWSHVTSFALAGALCGACVGTDSGNPSTLGSDEPGATDEAPGGTESGNPSDRVNCITCDTSVDCVGLELELIESDPQGQAPVRGLGCVKRMCFAVTETDEGCFVMGPVSSEPYDCNRSDEALMRDHVEAAGLAGCGELKRGRGGSQSSGEASDAEDEQADDLVPISAGDDEEQPE